MKIKTNIPPLALESSEPLKQPNGYDFDVQRSNMIRKAALSFGYLSFERDS